MCKLCGKTGHKQNTCTTDVFSETSQPYDNPTDIENDEDVEHHSNSSEGEGADDGDDEDDDLDSTQPPNNIEGNSQATEVIQDIEQSQSILQSASQQNRKKHKTAKRQKGATKSVKQSEITKFISGPNLSANDDKTQSSKTPLKQGSINVQKSPVTPTETLHDAGGETAKRSKKSTK